MLGMNSGKIKTLLEEPSFLSGLMAAILCFLPVTVQSQSAQYDVDSCEIRQIIEIGLQANEGDSSLAWAFQLIKGHCDHDAACQSVHLFWLSDYLEEQFALFKAIQVNDRIVELAIKDGDLVVAGNGRLNNFRFYEALGYRKLARYNLDEAIAHFSEAGDSTRLLMAELFSWPDQIKHEPDWNELIGDRLKRVDRLMNEADKERYYVNLLGLLASMDSVALLEVYLPRLIEAKSLEGHFQLQDSSTLDRWFLLQGYLQEKKRNYRAAIDWYERAWEAARAFPDPWTQASVRLSLAEVLWRTGEEVQARNRWEEGMAIARQLGLPNLLATGYKAQYRWALEKGNYPLALEAQRKMYEAQIEWSDRFSDFSIENYLLERERDRLAIENKNQQLALQIEGERRQWMFFLLFLTSLLGLVLLGAFWMLRKKNKDLETQNRLIEDQARKLKNISEKRDEFFYNISHELRTPLTVILGALEVLSKRKDLSKDEQQLIVTALGAGKQVADMAEGILEVRKLGMDKVALEESWVHFRPWVQQLMAQFDSIFSSKGIEAIMQAEVPRDLLVRLDKEKFHVIFRNLLGNAAKYTPHGGRVQVKLFCAEDAIHLQVTNEGKGIPQDQLQAIFDRFYRIPDAAVRSVRGVGIGLAICKAYVELMGGDIEVKSEPGKTTTFIVRLPVAAAEHISEEGSSEGFFEQKVNPGKEQMPRPSNRMAGKQAILVVEDSKELQDYLNILLGDTYALHAVSNGKEAIQWLEHGNRCDLVLSDVLMPEMDGYQLLKWLKRQDHFRHIPVIMLTAKKESEDRLRALRIGVDSYITKPFMAEELKVTIHNLLQRMHQASGSGEENGQSVERLAMSQEDMEWLEDFEQFVKDNLKNDLLCVSYLCEQFNMSEATLFRKVKRLTGLSPKQYITAVRLARARELLIGRVFNTVSKVAAEAGFADVRTFSRNFTKAYGRLPSSYLR